MQDNQTTSLRQSPDKENLLSNAQDVVEIASAPLSEEDQGTFLSDDDFSIVQQDESFVSADLEPFSENQDEMKEEERNSFSSPRPSVSPAEVPNLSRVAKKNIPIQNLQEDVPISAEKVEDFPIREAGKSPHSSSSSEGKRSSILAEESISADSDEAVDPFLQLHHEEGINNVTVARSGKCMPMEGDRSEEPLLAASINFLEEELIEGEFLKGENKHEKSLISEESLSDNLKEFLKRLGLKHDDLIKKSIDIGTLEAILNPSVYGRIVHFFVRAPLLLSLMRWPFVQRSGIARFKDARLTTPVELETDWEVVNASSVSVNTEEDGFFHEEGRATHKPSYTEHSRLMPAENTDTAPDEGIIFTSKGLLLKNTTRLKAIWAINEFYETFESIFEGLWSAFVSSLLVQGTFNYFYYPAEREGATLWDALGLTALLNAFCIESLDFGCFKGSDEGHAYEDALAAVLDEVYIWAPLVGIPLAFSIAYGLKAMTHAKALTEKNIRKLSKKLQHYQPSVWVDTLGWIVSTLIPDILIVLPLKFLLECLPQPEIKEILDRIEHNLIWDGRLSNEQRKQLFDNLLRFSQQHTQFTQLKAISTLAGLVENIDNFELLKEKGADKKTLLLLLSMKVSALQQLKFYGTHYQVLDTESAKATPSRLRYLFANYLLWGSRYPENKLLHPLLLLHQVFKLFFWLTFYKVLVQGIIEIVNRHIHEKACKEEGKVWGWIEPWQNNSCTYCGDLPIYVGNILSPANCLMSILDNPTTLEQLREFVNRFNGIDMSNFTTLDLSNQNEVIKAGNLTQLLSILAPLKLEKGIQFISLYGIKLLSKKDIESIVIFFQNTTGKQFYFEGSTLSPEGISVLADSLKNIMPDALTLSHLTEKDAVMLAPGLKTSSIFNLNIYDSNLGVEGIKAIAKNWHPGNQNQTILWLSNCNITSVGCIALANEVTRFPGISITLRDDLVNSTCAEAFAHKLKNMNSLDLGSGGYIDDLGIIAIAQSLAKNNSLFQGLGLTGYNVSESAILFLIDALQKSQLTNFYYTDNRFSAINYSIIIPRLSQALDKSNLNGLEWSGGNEYGLNDEAAELFAISMRNRTIKLATLSLSNNRIGPKGMRALAPLLSNINYLDMGNNTIGEGLTSLIIYQNNTNQYFFSCSNNNITDNDIQNFVQSVNVSNFYRYSVDLSGNLIGNEGAVNIISKLGQTTRQLNFNNTRIDTEGAIEIANALIKYKHNLWIDALNRNKNIPQHATNINFLNLAGNPLGNKGVQAICNILPYTMISREAFLFDTDGIDPDIVENCGVSNSSKTSAANIQFSLDLIYPYLWLVRLYFSIKHSFLNTVLEDYLSSSKQVNSSERETVKKITTSSHGLMVGRSPYFQLSTEQFLSTLTLLDASDYRSPETIIVNLDSHSTLHSQVDVIETDIILGSSSSNHFLIGSSNTLMDVRHSHHNNFLQSGKNNLLRLGFFSKDHVMVTEGQGTIKIEGFESKDTLHLVSKNIIYTGSNPTICQNEILEYNIPAAVIQLKETIIQLLDTQCEDIEDQISFNDEEAIYVAQQEVLNSSEDHYSLIYTSLLGVCETFLNSVSRSALFTAVPAFVTEILCRLGGHEREAAERFGQEMQTLLMLSFTGSPEALTASFIANWLMSHLTQSPAIISCASIVTSIGMALLTQDASLGWLSLQMGTALIGSVIGSMGVSKLPQIGRWGFNKVADTTNYVMSKTSFWSHSEDNSDSSTGDIPEQIQQHSSLGL